MKAGGDSTEDKCPNLHQKFDNHPMEAPPLADMNSEEYSEISKFPQIPTRSSKRLAFSPLSSPTFSIAAVSPGTSPSESKSNAEGTNMNSQHANLRPDVEMSPTIPCEVSHVVASQRPRISRSSSLTKIFNPKLKRAADPGSSYEGAISEPPIPIRELAQRSMHRSHSVPLIRKDGSVLLRGNIVRLIPISPQIGKEIHLTPFKSPTYHNDENIDTGEHISEEAVCRICLIEFGNSPETFKMECNCKGELALAHQECATKWQEVQNLSIELLPVHAVQIYNFQGSEANPVAITRYRQGLAGCSFSRYRQHASLLWLPRATSVLKEYIWIYAAVQLSLVIAFSHVFYSKLHMQAIVAVLLATFSGFGVTMALSSILEKILRRTRPWLDQSTHQTTDGSLTTDHASNASRSSTWSSTATQGPTAV
uniref:Zinc finger protein n=1 Tax=Cucumis sativus TaxID=3659 RepID=B3U2B0_CUCSA|nr:zinc finger protein [Cucumis sativus]